MTSMAAYGREARAPSVAAQMDVLPPGSAAPDAKRTRPHVALVAARNGSTCNSRARTLHNYRLLVGLWLVAH